MHGGGVHGEGGVCGKEGAGWKGKFTLKPTRNTTDPMISNLEMIYLRRSYSEIAKVNANMNILSDFHSYSTQPRYSDHV